MGIRVGTHGAEMIGEQVSPLAAAQLADLFYHAPIEDLIHMGNEACMKVHGRDVLLRGLIEYSNFCKSNCLYCGIRNGNHRVNRYRMEEFDLLGTIQEGYNAGFRTFVLQGGEDPDYPTERICRLVKMIKDQGCADAAITLSCGMRPREDYFKMVEAGADRYLLRFETSDPKLHFSLRNRTLTDRLNALEDIREAGFQVGSGFMLGLPGESEKTRLENVLLCQKLNLDMIGVGPFIPHPYTPLKYARQYPLNNIIQSVALLRLALPHAHIPATTAAGSLSSNGREQMIAAGANVLMPNLTPPEYKQHYLLYPNKICLAEKGIQGLSSLADQIRSVNRELSFVRGDALRMHRMV